MSDLRFVPGAVPSLRSPQLSALPRVRHAFFTRLGGVSGGTYESLNFRAGCDDDRANVRENFLRAAASLGLPDAPIVHTRQVHSDTIALVREGDGPLSAGGGGKGVDALITDRPGLVLAGFYADCQLVLLYDRRAHACAVIHSGWRGVANGIVPKTIARMRERFGTRPQELTVAVGPSICRACFETDDDVPDALRAAYGPLADEHFYRQGDKWHVDLKSLTYLLLVREGVAPLDIDLSLACTRCGDAARYWSHRRQGEARGVHAGMICLL